MQYSKFAFVHFAHAHGAFYCQILLKRVCTTCLVVSAISNFIHDGCRLIQVITITLGIEMKIQISLRSTLQK